MSCFIQSLVADEPPAHQLQKQKSAQDAMNPEDWAGIRSAFEKAQHEIQPDTTNHGQWLAFNSGQKWRTRFTGRHFLVTPRHEAENQATWSWGLALKSYGYGQHQSTLSQPQAIEAGSKQNNRFVYQHDETISEWFINDNRGVEHGFVLNQRPAQGSVSHSLTLTLEVLGGLEPQISPDGRDIDFINESNNKVVAYHGLKVWDKHGQPLASRFLPSKRATLTLEIDDQEAAYPITIDPIATLPLIQSANNESTDRFGAAIAVSGNTVVVGAMGEDGSGSGVNPTDNNNLTDSGAAYVFIKNPGGTWTQQAYLKAHVPGASDAFGWSVAISGDTIVVGARYEKGSGTGINPTHNDSASNAGAAYVFVRSGGAWSQQAYLKASNTDSSDWFGQSVAIDGDTIIVGASDEDGSGTGVNPTSDNATTDSGAAYVFVRSSSTWSQQAYLKSDNPDTIAQFGWSVAVHRDTVVVGEILGSEGLDYQCGKVHIFTRSSGVWSSQAMLIAPNPDYLDHFGYSVGIYNDIVIVGSRFEDGSGHGIDPSYDDTVTNSGAAYVFKRSSGSWSLDAYIKPPGTSLAYEEEFGCSVAIHHNTILIGAIGDDNGGYRSGAANIYQYLDGEWVYRSYLKSGTISYDERFGWGLAISETMAFAGTFNGGVVEPFEFFFTDELYGKAFNPGGDYFGYSVSISGDTAAVGAIWEAGSGTGINPSDNNTNPRSGAVYVFVKKYGIWEQEAYIKGPNSEFEDYFGWSVSVSADTLVVGAPYEDGNGTGINPADSGYSYSSGAAYIFSRSNGVWSQDAYVKASNAGEADEFGFSVTTSGDIVAVGAPGEDGSGTGINPANNNSANEAGAVYVFAKSSGTWSQQAYIKAGNATDTDAFGYSVGLSGETLIAGAPYESGSGTGVNPTSNTSAPAAGAAYIFTRSGGSWSQQAYLKASNTDIWDTFGSSVSVAGNIALVGAPGESGSGSGVNPVSNNSLVGSGAAYIFSRSGSSWSHQAYIKATNPDEYDYFGQAVAASEDMVIIGSAYEAGSGAGVNPADNDSGYQTGAAYVYLFRSNAWSTYAYLKAPNSGGADHFGFSVGLSNGVAIIGAPWEDGNGSGINPTSNNSGDDVGAFYLFY
ncbi:MAG: FG-GAP repeat protein [Prosthecobacter sp.]|nr:FG-GAP repeat protein [Prosthecobacter sp.]